MKVTTARLLKLREAGHEIVVSAPPYAGRAVTYAPRSKYDPQPWVFGMFRFSAGELRAERDTLKYVMHAAREAGFVRTHHGGAVPGVTQMNHDNGNVLMIAFEEGVFVTASGHGYGDAPWTERPWNTYDHGTFLRHIG